ncbi:MAG: hypothetical protein LBP67_05165 [Bacteroidales bacterium]|jgi:predicted transcriptional regulator|nr:hypothetical protein [Bacteroidales bacterium]
MNYIELIKGFWRSHEEHSFNTTEVAVYFHLLEICNICHWKNPFKRNNSKIEADLGISFNTLKNARNKLRQAGLIRFETRNGSPNVIYTLSNFDEVGDEVGDEINKTKTKLNKTKLNTLYPLQDIVDEWNSSTTSPLKKVKILNEKRKLKIKTRLLEFGKTPEIQHQTFLEIIEKIKKSDFMRGENKNSWIVTFDWIFENSTNWVKILEGNFDNKERKDCGQKKESQSINDKWKAKL